MRDRSESFFDVPSVRVRTSAGEVDSPIKYRDASATTVFFRVDAREADALLEPSGLSAARLGKGRGVLAITWFEYRDTSIGPYNELSIALLASPSRTSRQRLLGLLTSKPAIGAHVLHLPVTTEIARAGGVELYGYPKTVCEITLGVERRELKATLADGGRMLLEMQVPLGRGAGLPMPDLLTYSVRERELLATRISTSCKAVVCRAGHVRTTLGDSEHPIVRTLLRLGLPDSPSWTMYSEQFRSLLPLGEPIRTLESRAQSAA